MRTETRNPDAAGTADRAKQGRRTALGDTAAGAAPQSGRVPNRTEKAALVFSWLKAVKRHPGLSRLDAWAALDLTELLADDMTVFRSAAKLGAEIRCTRTAAAAALARLESAGLLMRAARKGRVGLSGGRPATVFRLIIPNEVLPITVGYTDAEVLPMPDGNTDGVLPTQDGMLLPTQDGTNSLEEPLEGAGARSRARPAPLSAGQGGSLSEPEADEISCDGRAPEGAPVKAPAGDLSPEHAADRETRAAASEMESGGDPFDFSDLPDLVGEAATELRALHGEAVDDAEALANDLADGFTNDDPDAANRAARRVAKLLLAAGSDARETWAAHRRIAGRLIDAFAMGAARAEAAKKAFDDAVGIAGKALLARREAETADREAAAHG